MSDWIFHVTGGTNPAKGDLRRADGGIVAAWLSEDDANEIIGLRVALAIAQDKLRAVEDESHKALQGVVEQAIRAEQAESRVKALEAICLAAAKATKNEMVAKND